MLDSQGKEPPRVIPPRRDIGKQEVVDPVIVMPSPPPRPNPAMRQPTGILHFGPNEVYNGGDRRNGYNVEMPEEAFIRVITMSLLIELSKEMTAIVRHKCYRHNIHQDGDGWTKIEDIVNHQAYKRYRVMTRIRETFSNIQDMKKGLLRAIIIIAKYNKRYGNKERLKYKCEDGVHYIQTPSGGSNPEVKFHGTEVNIEDLPEVAYHHTNIVSLISILLGEETGGDGHRA